MFAKLTQASIDAIKTNRLAVRERRSQPVVIVVAKAQVDSEVEPFCLEAGREERGRSRGGRPLGGPLLGGPLLGRPLGALFFRGSLFGRLLGRLLLGGPFGRFLGGLSFLCHRIWLLPLQRPCRYISSIRRGAEKPGRDILQTNDDGLPQHERRACGRGESSTNSRIQRAHDAYRAH